MDVSDVTSRYNDRLRVTDYADAATNGLQVGPEDRSVERIAFAVDAAAATISDAVEWGRTSWWSTTASLGAAWTR